jgi:hypothetical protein
MTGESLSRKRVLNPSKNNSRESRRRIAGYIRRHGNDPQDLRRAITRHASDSAAGGVRDEFDVGLLVALVRIGQLRLPMLPPARITARNGPCQLGGA